MDETTLTQIFLDEWKQRSPVTFRAQTPNFLERQARAMAKMAMAEIKAETMPGMMPEQVWSEIAPAMLRTPCPRDQPDD